MRHSPHAPGSRGEHHSGKAIQSMSKQLLRVGPVLVGALLCLVASGASADKLLFSGTHGITFTPNFGLPEVTATGTGVAEVNGTGGGPATLQSLRLTQHFTQIDTTLVVPTTATGLATKIPEVRLTGVRIDPQAAGGIFGPILAAVQSGLPLNTSQRTMPAAGNIRLCQVVGCATALSQVLSQTSGGNPIGVGVGGAFTIGGSTNPTRFTLVGEPWTVNTASVQYQTVTTQTTSMGTVMQTVTQTLTAMGFVQGPASMTGTTLSPTSDPISGTVQLVTAVQVFATGVPGPNDLSGQLLRLTIHFQPEPGRGLLLGAGALALGGLALRRRRA